VVDEARRMENTERDVRTLQIPDKLDDGLKVEVYDEWQVYQQGIRQLSIF
jgi:hypothetical protein